VFPNQPGKLSVALIKVHDSLDNIEVGSGGQPQYF
jgi:hypothetical protein